MTYTLLALIAVPVALVIDLVVVRTRVVLTLQWWIAYAITLAGQFAVNGWLTGRRIVTYDGSTILGTNHQRFMGDWRIFYAPVEDLGFGFALVLLTIVSWRWWSARDARRPASD
ncbi:MAG TPA: lycopene cyclase domain-containing protein [Flexivirga sp.]|uniref:lycopene cyclase domain-containing protein n=1 Tax=Flexivirga sp. TaxID=1962927 RepID=UPI002BD2AA25|nr:lycopene cyclase domain-containing protein [Flexivirga sp.]HWC20748.1 lycopene cyclase domain-containing protein [Flexivirga sp.]